MADERQPRVGAISWRDLTVADADAVRDFYRAVVGWETSPVSMDGYEDYCMVAPESKEAVAGICHARGNNAGLPPQWLVYITVADLDQSVAKCVELGGKAVTEPRSLGPNGRFCVIEDPAGAVAALHQPAGD